MIAADVVRVVVGAWLLAAALFCFLFARAAARAPIDDREVQERTTTHRPRRHG
jgi:hypothetical protein